MADTAAGFDNMVRMMQDIARRVPDWEARMDCDGDDPEDQRLTFRFTFDHVSRSAIERLPATYGEI